MEGSQRWAHHPARDTAPARGGAGCPVPRAVGDAEALSYPILRTGLQLQTQSNLPSLPLGLTPVTQRPSAGPSAVLTPRARPGPVPSPTPMWFQGHPGRKGFSPTGLSPSVTCTHHARGFAWVGAPLTRCRRMSPCVPARRQEGELSPSCSRTGGRPAPQDATPQTAPVLPGLDDPPWAHKLSQHPTFWKYGQQ